MNNKTARVKSMSDGKDVLAAMMSCYRNGAKISGIAFRRFLEKEGNAHLIPNFLEFLNEESLGVKELIAGKESEITILKVVFKEIAEVFNDTDPL